MKVRYTYRARIGKQAEQALMREWGACRWVWNQMVEENQRRHEQGHTFGANEQQLYLTRLRRTTVGEDGEHWLAACSNTAQQQTVRDYAKARGKALSDRKNKAKRPAGFPRFKSRDRSLPTLNYTKRGFSLRRIDGRDRLMLAKGIRINIVWSRPLPAEPSSVRIHRDAVGDWWASFVVDVEPEPLPSAGRAVGIDWGVKATANTTSPDHDMPANGCLNRSLSTLKADQRRMARRRPKKGKPASGRYRKAKRRAARTYRHVRNQRRDNAFKWAYRIVQDFDRIAYEDFHPAFLAKTSMARKAADNLLGDTKRILEYECERHGREVKPIPAPYTTQTCSSCGARAKRHIELGEDTFRCEQCGYVAGRDFNAAMNVLKEAGFDLSCAEDARHGTLRGDAQSEHGIPRL